MQEKDIYKKALIKYECSKSSGTCTMDEYTDEEIIIIDDFRADSMQFNELLILLDPYHSAPAPAEYRK